MMSFRSNCTNDFCLVNNINSASPVVEMFAEFAETTGKQNEIFPD
jgi:hypothetical protein